MKLVRDNYEEQYHEGVLFRETVNSQRSRKRLALLLSLFQCGSLLEIGCGKGSLLRLAEQHFDVQGVDISKYAIQTIKGHFGERVSVLDVAQSDLPLSKYNIIVALNILEHLQSPDEVIQKIFKALAPGGFLVGSVPNNQGVTGRLVTWIGNQFDRTHISTFKPDRWKKVFIHAGFSQLRFFGEIPFGMNRCRYIYNKFWPYISFNLMFTCRKD